MFFTLRKIWNILNDAGKPWQISLALSFGMIFSFMPLGLFSLVVLFLPISTINSTIIVMSISSFVSVMLSIYSYSKYLSYES